MVAFKVAAKICYTVYHSESYSESECLLLHGHFKGHLYMFEPINNAFAGNMYTSKTTMHCLTRQIKNLME